MDNATMVPSRLRYQVWWSAGVLLAPWLSAVLLYRVAGRLQPGVVAALGPGLWVAVRIQTQLAQYAGANHRRGQPGHLFPSLGVANWITLLRAAAVVALACFLPLAIPDGQRQPGILAWGPGIVYLGVSLADLLDGFFARKQGRETDLGQRLDIETDAAGLLIASLVAIALGRLPAVYLLVGLAYYVFILGIWLRRRRALPVIVLQPRPYARIVAGCQMGLVAMALLHPFNPAFTFAAAYIFMVPLLVGFLRDWLVVSGRVTGDGRQRSVLDHWAGSPVMKALPPALRLLLLAGGIETLAGGGPGGTHAAWRLTLGLFCLLAGCGVMGRSAALCLVLALGSSRSPFAASATVMMLFYAAAALILTGTGAWSLWAPEERILYRRKKVERPAECPTP